MDNIIDAEFGDDGDDPQDAVVEKFLGFVGDNAKPCIAKAIDYLMVSGLLLLQFFRCQPITTQELYDSVKDDPSKLTALNATSVYSCDASDTSIIFSSSNQTVNILIIIAVVLGLSYGFLMAIGIWIHSKKQADNVKVHPLTEKLYNFTDKIIIVDTLLEIPISFFWAPLMTIILWGFFALAVTAVFLIADLYNKNVQGDENAQAVFTSSAFLVVFSLFKLTGDISQYWVMFVTATVEGAEEKFEQYEEGGGNVITSTLSKTMSFVNRPKQESARS